MIIANAPGRAEWLGNHTDYNDGLVLGIGLEVGATVTARPTGDRQLVLRALDLDETRLGELDALSPAEAGFLARGAKAHGSELEIRSTVPMGAGLGSSAALECAIARALQQAWRTNFDTGNSMLSVIKNSRRHGRHSCGNCCELSEAHSR